ncbi:MULTISPECIES: hypothetical protein [unclassified Clostridium]|uniref:hypothetical protein n=1 Tax=unclassified Clostridium TaxID=2614128 RepID=UPI002079AE54|nr:MULTISPECIES: hypothetical protein [unclassified Clostridium]
MKAKIDNKVLRVEMVDSNYNDHASEVRIIEGTFNGRLCIVENTDLIVPPTLTLAQLVKLAKNSIEDLNDLEEHYFTELISQEILDTIQYNVSNLVKLSYNDMEEFKYNWYREEYRDIEYVKNTILSDTIEARLNGDIKRTLAQTRKMMLAEIMD